MRIFLWISFICTFCRKFFFNWTPGDDGPVQPGRSAELTGEKSCERWRWGWRRLERAVCSLMFLTKRRECGWIHGCGFVFYMIMSCCCIVLLTLTSYGLYICTNVFIWVWGEKHPKDAVMNKKKEWNWEMSVFPITSLFEAVCWGKPWIPASS